MSINLHQISRLRNQNQSYIQLSLAGKLKQTIQQMRLGLPVERLLQNEPDIAEYISQLQDLTPQLFDHRKKIYIDFPLTIELEVIQDQKICLEIPVNVGLKKDGTPLLIEWERGKREVLMGWQDKVKLWAAVEYWQVQPEKLKLILFKLGRGIALTKQTFSWSEKEHQTTQDCLIRLITGEEEATPNSEKLRLQAEMDAIEEVPI